MNEYKFVGTHSEDGRTFTKTTYIYADSKKEAVNRFIRDFKPIPFMWEFLGKV